jgi:ABC-2 type transport system permease protein
VNNILWLIRREFWENRSLWIAPLAIAGVILVLTAFGGVHIGQNESFWFGTGSSDLESMSPADRERMMGALGEIGDKRQMIYAFTLAMLTMVQLFALVFVVFFYLLDTLLAERKDRSILFWKSLPVSDTEVVTSKLLTAVVAAPIFVLLLSSVVQILFRLVIWARFGGSIVGDFLPIFDAGVWLQVQVASWFMTFTAIAWYLPLVGYLLLVSVWARRNAFLWAILPPVAVLIIEGMLAQSHHFADFLGRRFAGHLEIMEKAARNLSSEDRLPTLGEALSITGQVFTSAEVWIGLAAAAAFIVVTIRIRRMRDDS